MPLHCTLMGVVQWVKACFFCLKLMNLCHWGKIRELFDGYEQI